MKLFKDFTFTLVMLTDKNNYLNQYQLRKNANNKYKKLFMKMTTGKRSTDVSLLETSMLLL